MISGDIRINLKGLIKYLGFLSGNKATRPMLIKWGARYRAFVQRRFIKFSRGGGDWPPLKRKRKRGKLSSAKILRNTGTMLAALTPVFKDVPGQIQKYRQLSVLVGYGGPSAHPSGGTATIADIAEFHQTGAGNLPERKIIVPPDSRTLNGMAKDAAVEQNRLAARTVNESPE